jgi:hypothetical protein
LDFFNYATMIINTVSASFHRKDKLLWSQHDEIVGNINLEAIVKFVIIMLLCS